MVLLVKSENITVECTASSDETAMPFGNLRRRWEDNIKMVLREIDYVL
jgi:hypothetical protein